MDTCWDYKFPMTGKRNLKLQFSWFKRFSWLAYTTIGEQGDTCLYCVLFARDCWGKGNRQKLGMLVNKPFNNWKNATETLSYHNITLHNFIKNSVVFGENFNSTFTYQILDKNLILQELYKFFKKEKKLIPIIKTIVLWQESTLQRWNDSGPIYLNGIEPDHNDGHFRALLRVLVSRGDQNLINHIENQSLNNSYTSPRIQNSFILIWGKKFQDNLIHKINAAKSFSVLVDETRIDVSRTEQLTLNMRYLLRCSSWVFWY